VRGSIGSRQGVGGTAPERVAEQLAELTERVAHLVRDLDPVSA
jgi:argininosuccinate lyase